MQVRVQGKTYSSLTQCAQSVSPEEFAGVLKDKGVKVFQQARRVLGNPDRTPTQIDAVATNLDDVQSSVDATLRKTRAMSTENGAAFDLATRAPLAPPVTEQLKDAPRFRAPGYTPCDPQNVHEGRRVTSHTIDCGSGYSTMYDVHTMADLSKFCADVSSATADFMTAATSRAADVAEPVVAASSEFDSQSVSAADLRSKQHGLLRNEVMHGTSFAANSVHSTTNFDASTETPKGVAFSELQALQSRLAHSFVTEGLTHTVTHHTVVQEFEITTIPGTAGKKHFLTADEPATPARKVKTELYQREGKWPGVDKVVLPEGSPQTWTIEPLHLSIPTEP